MLLRSSKRLYMRIFYTLMEDKTCYFTLRTMNFTTMDEDKGLLELASYPTLEILTYPGHVRGEKHFSPPMHPVYKANKREHLYPTSTSYPFFFTHCQKTCYCVLQYSMNNRSWTIMVIDKILFATFQSYSGRQPFLNCANFCNISITLVGTLQIKGFANY